MAVKKETTEKKVAKKKPAAKTVKAPKEETVKKEAAVKVEKVEKAEKKEIKGKYFYGLGRRKSAVAQVRLYENDKATDADLFVNNKKLKDFFPIFASQSSILTPLKTVGMYGKVTMTAKVRGGGITGQAEAVKLGVARALVAIDEGFKKPLKDLRLLTRDSREVERKKPGLKKARKAPQWAKR
jgi:small subunit ribosomal protein S9